MDQHRGVNDTATPPYRSGTRVRVRGERWQVSATSPQLLTLRGLGPTNFGEERTLLRAFEAIESLDGDSSSWRTGSRQWRRAWRRLVAKQGDWSALHSAERAGFDPLPYQLEPVLAVIGGFGSRVLLADAVGLGKTVQAGVIVAELMARGAAERVLVLTPAGLRDQWAAELQQRFARTTTIVDTAGAARLTSQLPPGVNLWSTVPVAIASIDYVKRPEVLPLVRAQSWDVVVIDEAHLVTPGSDRHAALSELCRSALFVVLVTATPHNGDRQAFTTLCALGERHDPLLVFRRTRADVRLGITRHVHHVNVMPSAAEVQMHAALDRYAAAVRNERGDTDPDSALLLTILYKRAFSSPESLRLSIARRLAVLAAVPMAVGRQMWLPLDDGNGETDSGDEAPMLAQPVLEDPHLERQLLRRVLDASTAALQGETKLAALGRLLRRLRRRGEAAIVFTEYRDTLAHIQRALQFDALLLHGGLTRSERKTTVAAFVSGERPLLLATDAGGEGLNLHDRCRLVVHVELPWNPARLEQRMGRVDRIGQRRTVHAYYLVGRQSGETSMLDRLQARIARARQDIGSADPLVSSTFDDQHADLCARAEHDSSREWQTRARDEAARIISVRCMSGRDVADGGDRTGCFVARTRNATRQCLRGQTLLILGIVAEDAMGRSVASGVVGVIVQQHDHPRETVRREAKRLVAATGIAQAAIEAMNRFVAGRCLDGHSNFWSAALERARDIAAAARLDADIYFQPGLFDRRADRLRHVLSLEQQIVVDDATERVHRLVHASQAPVVCIRTRIVLLP